MNLKTQYETLARYNSWMNRKLYAAAGTLSDEQRKHDCGAFFHSIHGTLNHLLLADRAWMQRFTHDASFASRTAGGDLIEVRGLDQILYADFAELERERVATDERIEAWIRARDEADFASTISYRTSAGTPREHPLWWAVGHLFNHQTHHRGQVTTLLSQFGVDPGVTDLVRMPFEGA
jgi:uncharacterized damage-inducible protein DinB